MLKIREICLILAATGDNIFFSFTSRRGAGSVEVIGQIETG